MDFDCVVWGVANMLQVLPGDLQNKHCITYEGFTLILLYNWLQFEIVQFSQHSDIDLQYTSVSSPNKQGSLYIIWLLPTQTSCRQHYHNSFAWSFIFPQNFAPFTAHARETNSSPLKIGRAPKGNEYSNHPFSGAMLNFREGNDPYKTSVAPARSKLPPNISSNSNQPDLGVRTATCSSVHSAWKRRLGGWWNHPFSTRKHPWSLTAQTPEKWWLVRLLSFWG